MLVYLVLSVCTTHIHDILHNSGEGYAQIIDDQFAQAFGSDVLRGMVGAEPSRFNNKKRSNAQADTLADNKRCAAFKSRWSDFDFTSQTL
jgi:Protein similar to CwfJ C-terminus 2